MIAAAEKIPLERLVDQTKPLLLTALADGGWHRVGELHACVPDHLADACLENLHENIYHDQPDHREFGRLYLIRETVRGLNRADQVEQRTTGGGKDEVRLDPALVPAPGKVTPPTTQATAAPPSLPATDRTQAPVVHPVSPFDDEPAREAAMPGPDAAPREAVAPLPVADGQVLPVDAESFGNPAVRQVDPDLPIHELANLFPEAGPEDYQRIEQDIVDHGQQVAAWLFEGQVLDGRTRLKVCRAKHLKLRVQDWHGPGDPVAFVLSLNLHRRHLDESQRALVGANIKTFFEEEARQRKRAGKAAELRADLPEAMRPREQAAQLLNVSPRSVENANKVIKKGSPELVQAVQEGKVKVDAAAVLAELPPEEQNQTLEEGKQAVKAQVQRLRQRKSGHKPRAGYGDPDRRVLQKPEDGKQRRAVAVMLWDFLGKKDCLAMAKLWTTIGARGSRAGAKKGRQAKGASSPRRR